MQHANAAMNPLLMKASIAVNIENIPLKTASMPVVRIISVNDDPSCLNTDNKNSPTAIAKTAHKSDQMPKLLNLPLLNLILLYEIFCEVFSVTVTGAPQYLQCLSDPLIVEPQFLQLVGKLPFSIVVDGRTFI